MMRKFIMAALAAVTMTFTAQAEKTAKAVVEDDGATLKFVYDETDYGAKDTDWFSVAEAEAQKPSNHPPWYDKRIDFTTVIFDASFANYRPQHCGRWFLAFASLETIEGLSNLDTSAATSFTSMFEGCTLLTSLDLSGFDTANATNMDSMFCYCSGLERIYASDKFVTKRVNSSNMMFYWCMSLRGGKNTSVTADDKTYARIDGGTSAPGYFSENMKTAKVLVEDRGATLRFVYDVVTPHGTKDTDWFSVAEAEAIDPYNEDVPWWKCGETVTNVVFDSSFAACRPKQCGSWFCDFGVLAAVDGLKNLNTSVTTNMAYMFYGCSSLTSLDVSGFNTSNVTHMSSMFYDCSSLTSIDVSGFNTSNVTDLSYMFYGCSSPSLTTLNVSGFDTANVTAMRFMFFGCSSLTTLDVSGFNTANVLNMGYMFGGCSSLTTLDVSGFNTAKVTDMVFMFYGCSRLEAICASDRFVTDQVSDSDSMFKNCSKLKGGAGTVYDFAVTDREYARIDGGPSSATPGYFTTKQSAPYIVRYHKYDGSGTTRDQTVKSGAETRLLYMDSQLKWSRSGYEFVGWAPDENSRLCKYLNGDVVLDLATENGATVHLYATWLSPSSYRVCFHRNFDSKDETKLNQIVLRNTETVLAGMNNLIKWTRTGYAFMGWAETAGGAVKYANCAKVLNLSSIAGGTKHLYAVWKASQTVAPPVKPQTSNVKRQTSNLKPQTSNVKRQTSNLKPQTSNFKPQTSNLISGVFADGSGWFDLIVEEDGLAFFRAETEDGVREAECEADEVDDTLVLTFADAAPLVIRLEGDAWVVE